MKARDMSVQAYLDWDLRRQQICREDHEYDVLLSSRQTARGVMVEINSYCRPDLGLHDPSLRDYAIY